MSNLATLPAKPSALPREWVDRLFSRFAAMYGKHWLDQWAGIPVDEVKATWAADLAGVSGEQIRRAMDYCKTSTQWPPTLPQFVGFCYQFRQTVTPALPAPMSAPSPEVRKQLGEFLSPRKDKRAWARRLLERKENGEHIHQLAEQFAREALGAVE